MAYLIQKNEKSCERAIGTDPASGPCLVPTSQNRDLGPGSAKFNSARWGFFVKLAPNNPGFRMASTVRPFQGNGRATSVERLAAPFCRQTREWLQIRAKLYVFRMRLKSASFAGSVNEPIDVTQKVLGGRS